MSKLRGSSAIVSGALIIMAGVGAPAAVATQATAATAVAAPATGVDVSNLNTINSWPDVKQAGNSFTGVLVSEGNFFQNKYLGSQVGDATAAGLYTIPYVFAFPYGAYETNPPNGTAAQQADYAVNYMAAQFKTTPPSGSLMEPFALDLENDPNSSTESNSNMCYGLTPTQMVQWIQSFMSEANTDLGKLGSSFPVPETTPIIYTTQNWWDTCTGDSTAFANSPLWVADYEVSAPAIPAAWGNYTFWQYTDAGTVSGIANTVDQDYLGPLVVSSTVNSALSNDRISTLTSLRGNGDTFSSTTLPPGLSISSAGQVTGTPTTIGQYSVDVTPSSGAVPSSVPFTWDVHGAITVTGSAKSGTAGTPVIYQVASSGPDQTAGFAPSYTASGLPTGLSISSTGLITGWPSKPGTYSVKVTATDRVGGSGSVSFTWTIGAAANSGTTGTIKQIGGSAKCLNDTGGKTTNGNQPQMYTCGASNENWTWVQDGTIRFGGKCLQMAGTGSAADTPLELETCSSGNTEQQWRAGSDSEIVNPSSGKCFYVGENDPTNGYKPDAHACGNDLRHHFLRPAAPVTAGVPGKCLSLSASAVEEATCANVSTQHWVGESNGEFEVGSNSSCLKENGTTAGATVSTGPCSATSTYDLWTVTAAASMPLGSELKNAASGLCVAIPSASAASGTRVLMEPCAATPATPEDTWHLG